jgi:hypothetical protein
MSKLVVAILLTLCLTLTACNLPVATTPPPADTSTPIPADTSTPIPTDTSTAIPPTSTNTLAPTVTVTSTPLPIVERLDATVTADLLSCRYGPGSEYLFLYGLRKGAQIQIIGQTGGNNWVWVDGKNKCWVNVKFIEIAGDFHQLPIVYPDLAPLPRSPYYPATTILSATRNGNQVTIAWADIPLRPGDEEDDSMLHYIVEVWRCEAGELIFDPLATNDTSITFWDEPGCAVPSHGNVYVQEKHGFAGPTVIPWP